MIGTERVIREVGRGHAVGVASPIASVSVATDCMGGRLVVHVAPATDVERARHDARRTLARVERWASRLSRHVASSELSRLNADPRSMVTVRPTLAAALRAGLAAGDVGDGLVDITLLDARLAAEGLGPTPAARSSPRSCSLGFGPRGTAVVRRPPTIRFDLGGVAKGWLADRALRLLSGWPSALIDADGDLAVRCAPGQSWAIEVDDPHADGDSLAVLRLSAAHGDVPRQWGVATSGTSVHRWGGAGEIRHHLIDPRTGVPAVTDVVQATVICGSALGAEALAKAAVIAGSLRGLEMLDRAGVHGALVLTDRGETLALPSTMNLLEAPARASDVRGTHRA